MDLEDRLVYVGQRNLKAYPVVKGKQLYLLKIMGRCAQGKFAPTKKQDEQKTGAKTTGKEKGTAYRDKSGFQIFKEVDPKQDASHWIFR